MLFQPGRSGNPNGRTTGTVVRSTIYKGWAEKNGVPLLQRIAMGKERGYENKFKLRADVAMFLVEQELGKARQSIEHNGSMTVWDAITSDGVKE